MRVAIDARQFRATAPNRQGGRDPRVVERAGPPTLVGCCGPDPQMAATASSPGRTGTPDSQAASSPRQQAPQRRISAHLASSPKVMKVMSGSWPIRCMASGPGWRTCRAARAECAHRDPRSEREGVLPVNVRSARRRQERAHQRRWRRRQSRRSHPPRVVAGLPRWPPSGHLEVPTASPPRATRQGPCRGVP